MKKNGFTLIEVVVTIVIVIIVGVAIASTCLIATTNTNKTRIINFAINEMQNMQKIFEKASIVNSGNISYDELEQSIINYYGNEVQCVKQDNSLKVNIFFDIDYSIKLDKSNCVKISFDYDNHNVIMSAVVSQKQNEIYNNNNIFCRWVEV